ncbi:MAG: phosphotransferase [Bdellovibrionaceae bacterium]|nr:phosphotransferase [Pseudobdellovibrionaceae bacterium]
MQLPSSFLKNIKAVDGDQGLLWLESLEHLIEDLSTQWGLSLVTPLQNLSFNFVATAKARASETEVILKVSPPTRSVWNEVRWLRHYRKVTPTLLEFESLSNAFLLKRCHSGDTLRKRLPGMGDEAVTRVICRTIKALRSSATKDDSFRHLSDLISDFNALEAFTDKRLFAKAQDLFGDLTRDRSQDILLHGDLHHENILSHEDDWLVIDPHGYQGHPAAEAGVMIYNPIDGESDKVPSEALLDQRFRILVEELQDDPQLIQAWCFCKAMLSAAWNVKDFPRQSSREIEIALRIEKWRF